MNKNQSTMSQLNRNYALDRTGAHILYMYSKLDPYIDNAIWFILKGLEEKASLLVIETEELIGRIREQLGKYGIEESDLTNVIFVSSEEFYLSHHYSSGETNHLNQLLKPFIDEGHSIRTWGHIPPTSQAPSMKEIITFECSCDQYILNNNIISVCCYNDLTTPAYLQNELMRVHTHFMTDEEYARSPLYNMKNLHTPINKKLEKLKQIEEENIDLLNKNSHLTQENTRVKMTNELIKQKETKLRTIINELPIPVIIRRETKLLFTNDLALEIIVQNEAELQSLFEMSEHRTKQECQFTLYGKKRYFIMNSISVLFENERALLHSFIDITQEKANEQLIVRSEKMNIAGELAASIAHELRNPLTAIKGFFSMLRADSDKSKEMYYNIIENELSRVEQISSELLTLAKPHSENRKRYNLVTLIEEVRFLLTSEANMKCIEIITRSEKERIDILCEDTKIKQVFINLIKNGIDAMEENGRIVIEIAQLEQTIQVRVIDQGQGIPEELLTKMGEPFYTTKEKGTGLGLMICYQIIEKHNGTIHVDSELGKGTTFTITFPVIEESAAVLV